MAHSGPRWLIGRAPVRPGTRPGASFEPATQRKDVLVSMRVQEESHPRARRLAGLRAIEDHLAGLRDHLTWLVERIGRDPPRPWDAVRDRLDVERRPQIGDHEVVARVESLPEVERVIRALRT